MGILIDGYNLLNATGVEGTGRGTELERARRGLLQFLSNALTTDECSATTIVFDAQGAPPGLPTQESFQGITVLFSKGYAEADDLLEELIAADHVPRKLLVVSSDHRLHRAARRRKATPVDSEIWISQLRMRGPQGQTPSRNRPPQSPEQTDHWLAEFADIDVAAIQSEVHAEDRPSPEATSEEASPPTTPESKAKRTDRQIKDGVDLTDLMHTPVEFPDDFASELEEEMQARDEILNPFPPGFGEDLFDE